MKKQILILAAGEGRRLRPYSSDCHKALLKIADNRGTLLHTLASLQQLDVKNNIELTVVCGYREADIRAEVLRVWPTAVCIENPEYASQALLHSLALALAQPHIAQSNVIVLFADTYYHPSALQHALNYSGDAPAIAVQPQRSQRKREVSVTMNGTQVEGVGNDRHSDWQMAPIVIWPHTHFQHVFAAVRAGADTQWQVINRVLADGGAVLGLRVTELVFDIDSPDDLNAIRKCFE